MCVMREYGPRCTCEPGFERDRQRQVCVPREARARGPLPEEEPAGMCSPAQVRRVEEALGKAPLDRHCRRYEVANRGEGTTYAGALYDRYRRKRLVGYSLTFALAPLFAGGAAALWVAAYRIEHSGDDDDEDAGSMANFGYLAYFAIIDGAIICTAAAAALLTVGIVNIVRGKRIMEQLGPLVREDRHSRRPPRVAVAPFFGPSGGGAGLVLEF